MNTHIADDTSAQEGVPTHRTQGDQPKESTVAKPAQVELTEPFYTTSELAEATGITGRRLWRVCQEEGVDFTREEDGLRFTTNTGLVQALYQRFGILAAITLVSEESGEGELIIQEEPGLDDAISMTLDVTALEEDDAPDTQAPEAVRPADSADTQALNGKSFAGTVRLQTRLQYPDVQAETKRVLKGLVEAVIDGETALITQQNEHARQIEETLTNHGVELKRRANKLLDLATHSRNIRQRLSESQP